MITPSEIQLIGNEIAIRWSDGAESFFAAPALRAASPSAETMGEKDILGRTHGGVSADPSAEVQVLRWEKIGNYALRFEFSDGHRTGLYSFDYLRKLSSPSHS